MDIINNLFGFFCKHKKVDELWSVERAYEKIKRKDDTIIESLIMQVCTSCCKVTYYNPVREKLAKERELELKFRMNQDRNY